MILRTLKALKRAFKAVFYTVGNHELWHTRRDAEMGVRDSAEKASLILEACKGIGVDVEPRALGGVWVVPVLSW